MSAPGLTRLEPVAPPPASPPPAAPPAPPVPEPPAVLDESDVLSPGQLMRRRFARHRLAAFSLRLLVVIYLVALLAEFVAPAGKADRNVNFAYAPPQLPRFDFRHGLYVLGLRQHIDPVTFRKSYREDPNLIIPLELFGRAPRVRLWGLIPIEHRLLAIDREALAAAGTDLGGDSAIRQPSFYLLGADKYGRDVFSRIVYGSRVSLSIGLFAIVVTFLLGLGIGGLSGYCGGAVDTLVQRLIEIINSFPHLPFWLALAAVLPADWPALGVYFAITLVLSALNWTGLARVVRGKMLALREEEYAMAARLLGASNARIITRHLLPGFASHAIVVLTMSIPGMILGETALSFLGLGLRPPVVSWGVMLQDAVNLQAVANYPWLLLPVLPIVLTVLCFNFVGDGLRDAADPYSES